MDTSILVVEEHAPLRRVLRDWLEVLLPGCLTIAAASIGEAIAVARPRPVTVILITVDPLRGDPVKDVRRIKDAVPAAHVVALGQGDDRLHRTKLKSAGASAYVPIWHVPTELARTVKTLLGVEDQQTIASQAKDRSSPVTG